MSDDRITELEIRLTLQQDELQQLSDVVARQARELDELKQVVDDLRKRSGAAEASPFDPDEKPPHY